MRSAVTGVLLAAGAGRHAGGPKALRRDADGTSWLLRSVGVLRAGGCGEVLVVLGCDADAARQLLVGVPVVVVENPSWPDGLGSSLGTGLLASRTRPGPTAWAARWVPGCWRSAPGRAEPPWSTSSTCRT